MEDMKKQSIHLEDGRLADKIVQETLDPTSGESKIVTEIHAEPKIEKHLAQRITEVKKPVVVRREIENVDELTGEVVDRKVESIAPDVRMELREHIQTNVSALGVKEDCDCYVTKEDMMEGFMAVARALNHDDVPVSVKATSVGKVSMQEVVADKIEGTKIGMDLPGMLLWGTIAALSAVFVYVVFLM